MEKSGKSVSPKEWEPCVTNEIYVWIYTTIVSLVSVQGVELGRGASMRVRIQPRMLVYAVYLVEHEYQGQGQCQGEGHDEQIPQSPTDNTVQDEPDQPMQISDLQTNITQRELYNQGKCGDFMYDQLKQARVQDFPLGGGGGRQPSLGH